MKNSAVSVAYEREGGVDQTSPEAMRRLGHDVARRIRETVLRLAESEQGEVKRLQGHEGELRLRVGKWRVRFIVDYEEQAIRVLCALPRGSAYRE